MDKRDTFASRLCKALEIRNIKPAALSRMTKITKGQISQYMHGFCEARQDKFYLIANALNVDYAWLMGYDVPMEKESEEHLRLREQIKEKILYAPDNILIKINSYIDDIYHR